MTHFLLVVHNLKDCPRNIQYIHFIDTFFQNIDRFGMCVIRIEFCRFYGEFLKYSTSAALTGETSRIRVLYRKAE